MNKIFEILLSASITLLSCTELYANDTEMKKYNLRFENSTFTDAINTIQSIFIKKVVFKGTIPNNHLNLSFSNSTENEIISEILKVSIGKNYLFYSTPNEVHIRILTNDNTNKQLNRHANIINYYSSLETMNIKNGLVPDQSYPLSQEQIIHFNEQSRKLESSEQLEDHKLTPELIHELNTKYKEDVTTSDSQLRREYLSKSNYMTANPLETDKPLTKEQIHKVNEFYSNNNTYN